MEKVRLNSQFYFLKNAMKIILPVSVFSLVFPSLLHSFHEFSSYFSIQLFTYSSERNYIFLLCNGILVFIIKNSGLISTNISDQESHKEFKSTEFKNQETKTEFLEKVVEIDQNQEKEEEQIETMSEDDLVSVGTIDEKEDQESYVEIIEELEEEEETLEELHKKCEDFIKRIKSEINRKN